VNTPGVKNEDGYKEMREFHQRHEHLDSISWWHFKSGTNLAARCCLRQNSIQAIKVPPGLFFWQLHQQNWLHLVWICGWG